MDANRLHENKKLARLSGSPFVMVGSPSYPDQPFSVSTQSKEEIMSICERCWVGQRGERSVKVTRLGAGGRGGGGAGRGGGGLVDPSSRDRCSPYKHGLQPLKLTLNFSKR